MDEDDLLSRLNNRIAFLEAGLDRMFGFREWRELVAYREKYMTHLAELRALLDVINAESAPQKETT